MNKRLCHANFTKKLRHYLMTYSNVIVFCIHLLILIVGSFVW